MTSSDEFEDYACPNIPYEDKNTKRAKVTCADGHHADVVSSVNTLIQLKANAEVARLIQSAPTSFNGSSNPNPVLDIQVSLPNGEVMSEDPGHESRNERR